MLEINKINEKYQETVKKLISDSWGSNIMITRGKIHKVDELPGYIALESEKIVGLITYNIENNELEITSLDSFQEGTGIGTCLLNKAIEVAREQKLKRVWLITTNDNTNAMRFYQKRGFDMIAIHRNAVVESRRLKPEIPMLGDNLIPINHEVEFEYDIQRKVEVTEYNPNWPKMFEDESNILKSLLGDQLITIHHIGSTSIPNIPAKPIIDVMPVVKIISDIDKFEKDFVKLGYIPMGEYGIQNRRFFIKGTFENRTHHIHIFQEGDENIDRHLAFRDFMIMNPDKAKEYGDLKLKLAREFEYDIDGYIDGKDGFIKEIDRRISGGV